MSLSPVIPVKAGTQTFRAKIVRTVSWKAWVPAFAGMTD